MTPGSPTMSEKLVSLHLFISLQSQIGPLLMALRQQPIASSDNDGSVWAGVEPIGHVGPYWARRVLKTRATVMSEHSGEVTKTP